ncbi:MAG TPA: J domain-containing protein [Sphingomicrobium sp.]|nr:J domain-containing protein [Sphingomicrobium sp.]
MARGASAYAVLGLEPGANLSAIEQAYRRLIKQHHPDREGGDPARAAEINNAYRELKAIPRDPLELHRHPDGGRSGGRGWTFAAAMIALGAAVLLLLNGPVSSLAQPSVGAPGHVRATAPARDVMDKPLHIKAIDRSTERARNLFRTSDEMALSTESRACHGALRSRPTVEQLDRCAAFDNAVILLQDRDPLRDRGPFSQHAVTARLWIAASTISNDYLAIDSRFHRIRLRVELALAPPDEPYSAPINARKTPEPKREVRPVPRGRAVSHRSH